MGELTTQRFPWEPAVQTTEETVKLLQRDFVYAMQHTAVLVRSTHEDMRMLANTARGQIIPRGVCKLNNSYGSDPHEIEFQDLGMPQVGAPQMTVQELMARVWNIAKELGLELI